MVRTTGFFYFFQISPELFQEAERLEPVSEEAQGVRGLRIVAGILSHFSSAALMVGLEETRSQLEAVLHLERLEKVAVNAP